MLTSDKAKVVLSLYTQVLENDLDLIIFADNMQLFVLILLVFLVVSVFVVFGTWGKGETAIALEKITHPLEFLFELRFALRVSYVH